MKKFFLKKSRKKHNIEAYSDLSQGIEMEFFWGIRLSFWWCTVNSPAENSPCQIRPRWIPPRKIPPVEDSPVSFSQIIFVEKMFLLKIWFFIWGRLTNTFNISKMHSRKDLDLI